MFWRRSKPAKPQESLIAFLDEGNAPQPDPEKSLAKALREYETEFYKKISSALDQDAERAKKVVQQARTFIQDSRLAYALCRPLLEHVQYWPSWSKREDFHKYADGPFLYIAGSNDNAPKSTTVTFSYSSVVYTLRFFDEGMSSWATDDPTAYGKLELITGDKTVLGLDISIDLRKGDLAHWWMTNVYAFLPGLWMKELIEMAAYIDGMKARKSESWQNNDALERAKEIRVPPE